MADYHTLKNLLKGIDINSVKQWSEKEIKKGIVIESINLILESIGIKKKYEIVRSDKGRLLYIRDWIRWQDLRVKIVGIEATQVSIKDNSLTEGLKDISREALTFFILPNNNLVQFFPSKEFSNLMIMLPNDILALLNKNCTIEEIINFKLYRTIYLEKDTIESQFDNNLYLDFKAGYDSLDNYSLSISETLKQRNLSPDEWADHPLTDRINLGLTRQEIQVLIGPSASGKTTLALQVGWNQELLGKEIQYINIAQVKKIPKFLFTNLLQYFQTSSPYLVIFDDTQSNPNLSRYISKTIYILQETSLNIGTGFLFLVWPGFAIELLTHIIDSKAIHIRAEQIRSGIISKFGKGISKDQIKKIVKAFGTDLFLLRESISYIVLNRKIPTINDLASQTWERWREIGISQFEPEAKRILLITSSLGRFDLSISKELLMNIAQVDFTYVQNLLDLQILRQSMNTYSLGHISFSTLIGDWLYEQGVWTDLEKKGGPAKMSDVIHDYLRSLSPSKTVETLRVLHTQSGFKGYSKLSHRTGALIEIWQMFDSVLERISYQQSQDPTWGKSSISTMFAVQALCSVGRYQDALESINFLRSLWNVDKNGNVQIDMTKDVTIEDFKRIGQCMFQEDKILARAKDDTIKLAPAKDIDIFRMYKSWLYGVLISAEASFDRNSEHIKKLINHKLKTALKNGAYYPERVPWVTARVLLGLSAAGVTAPNNKVVRNSINWLLRDRRSNGASAKGIWESGTGTWNSTLETTSMVVLALINCGLDPNDERFNSAKRLIISSRINWTSSSNILDGAISAEAYLATGGSWDDIVEEVRQLSLWTKTESFWKSATKSAKETFDQTCRVSQTACHLVNVGWNAIKTDLPSLVNALAVPVTDKCIIEEKKDEKVLFKIPAKKVEFRYPIVESLLSISELSLLKITVLGNYRRYNERSRNLLIDWSKRIMFPLRKSSLAHENFLVWASPGSGKTFFIKEIARAMKNNVKNFEFDIAKMSKSEIKEGLIKLSKESMPVLCLIDEVDARAEESWPYEIILPYLDLNTNPSKRAVFILIGSTKRGIEGLATSIKNRPKGRDILDRIPFDKRFIIDSLDDMDKVALMSNHILEAAKSKNCNVDSIEKFALYYVVMNENLTNPRQIKNLAISTVQRLPANETKVRYIDLFERNDLNIHRFWIEHQKIAEKLSDVFIYIKE